MIYGKTDWERHIVFTVRTVKQADALFHEYDSILRKKLDKDSKAVFKNRIEFIFRLRRQLVTEANNQPITK